LRKSSPGTGAGACAEKGSPTPAHQGEFRSLKDARPAVEKLKKKKRKRRRKKTVWPNWNLKSNA
jgi:hypothetical protein